MPLMQTVRLPNIGHFFRIFAHSQSKIFSLSIGFLLLFGKTFLHIFIVPKKWDIINYFDEKNWFMVFFFTSENPGLAQWARKFKKVQGKKNSWNKINQFHEKNFFDQIPFFCNFKNGQKSFFELGKSLNLPKMQFH